MNMKLLWFPGNGALYSNDNKYNGGGWTGALANALRESCPNIELGLVIPWQEYMEDTKGGIKIYGLPRLNHSSFNYEVKLAKQIEYMKKIVENYKPDLIHVFGSEHTGGMVVTITEIPVVLHLQGILNFLKESWLPQNMSWEKYILWSPRQWFDRKNLKRACKTERTIMSSCRFFMGRTEMDKRVSRIMSPQSEYFYCSEMLRPEIYNSNRLWSYHERNRKCIVSVISAPLYKGGDILLRTAKILKEHFLQDFEWRVYGVDSLSECERLVGIKHDEVNVKISGVINSEQLIGSIIDADVFVHPSYIENSANTICEAQNLGIPVVANYTGGITSLITHGDNGILVPPSDPYVTASYVDQLAHDKDYANRIGINGRETAHKRHNPETILNDIINIYSKILSND